MTAVEGIGALYEEAVKLCLLMLPHSSPEVRDAFAAVLGCLAAACQTSEALVKVCYTCRKDRHICTTCQLAIVLTPGCRSRHAHLIYIQPCSNAVLGHGKGLPQPCLSIGYHMAALLAWSA